MAKRLNVRCCCTPTKIYGTVPVPDYVLSGELVEFVFRGGESLTLQAQIVSLGIMQDEKLLEAMPQELRDQITKDDLELALKYEGDDIPPEQKLQVLRRIQGFQEDALS